MRKSITMASMLAAAVLVAAAPAAGATLSLKPQPSPGQTLREHSGRPAIQSQLKGTTAALVIQSVTLDETGSANFLLALQNSGPTPVSLTAADVAVLAGDAKVAVYSVEDLKQAAHEMQLFARSHINAMDKAGVMGAPQTHTAYVSLPGGRYIQDPNPPRGSKKRVLEEANRRLAVAEAVLAQAETSGFRPVVMAPGANGWTGLTLAALPKGARTLTINVTLGADAHRFELSVDR